MNQIRVRPTELLHGEIYLTSQIVISPKEGWKDIPFNPTAPKGGKELAVWNEVMNTLRHYHKQGKIEVNCFNPQKIKIEVDPFWCADPQRNHPGVKLPATYGSLCAYCFNHASPDERS